ncbi:MAG: DUF4190 domain-containing protein [Flavobacteriales bacterium]|nr:DUF4190 domain-containing protein [Flavobacteriales bacterium]
MYDDDLLDIVPYEPRGNDGKLPDSSLILTMGIISLITSIICCFLYGLPGLVTGIIGIVLGNKSLKLYKEDPGAYSTKSYKDVNAGYICSIIGVCISGLLLVLLAIAIIVGMSMMPQDIFNM